MEPTPRENPLPKTMDAVIFGAGGHARVVADAMEKQGVYRLVAYLLDKEYVAQAPQYEDAPTLDVEEWLATAEPSYFIVAVGDNKARREKTLMFEQRGHTGAVVIHPFTSIGARTTIGPGTLICAKSMTDPDVQIGRGVIINACTGIGHGSVVGDFVHLAAGAGLGAECHIGENTFLAVRSSVISHVNVGKDTFVAAAALVTKDVGDDVVAIGSPARIRSKPSADN